MMAAEAVHAVHTLGGLLRGLDGVSVRHDIPVTGLALDSRKVQSGDLFIAIAGTQTHGLQHARQAVALGATAVAWEPVADDAAIAEIAALLPVPVVAVPDLGQVVGLVLEFADGQTQEFRMDYQNQETYANGERVYVTPAEVCSQ